MRYGIYIVIYICVVWTNFILGIAALVVMWLYERHLKESASRKKIEDGAMYERERILNEILEEVKKEKQSTVYNLYKIENITKEKS